MAFVHLASETEARPYLEKEQLHDVPRISDPDAKLYRAFLLPRITIWKFLRPIALLKSINAAISHGFGAATKGEFQMPAVFLIHQGRIIRSYVYPEIWEHPDFLEFSRV